MLRAALVAAGLVAAAASTVAAGPNDFFTEQSKEFGPTPRGPVLLHYFYIKNTSNQPLQLGQARVSCGCVSAQVLNYNVAPGESTAVLAQMDSRRIPRSYEPWTVTVFVPFYGQYMNEARVTVTATAREDLHFTESSFAFGTVKKGQGAKRSTRITFQSDPAWEVTGVKSNGTHISAETKLVSRNGNDVTYDVIATLAPDCPVGNWTAEVFVKTSNKAVEKLRIPVTVLVPQPIEVTADPATAGELKVGKAATREIVLKSADPFKVIGIKGSDDDVVLEAAAADLKESKEHRLVMKVSPNKPGSLARTFEIMTDHKQQPKIEYEFKAVAIK